MLEADAAFTVLLADPEVQRVGNLICAEERTLGDLLSQTYQPLVDQWERASSEEVLTRVCAGKHGQHGRICLLDAGHDEQGPHWGLTADGLPVAWLGSAPDDD